MFIKPILSSKITGRIVQCGEKILGKNGLEICAPARACTYDVLTGIGKKGHYQQYIFRSEKGKAVQIYTRYNKDGAVKDVVTDYGRVNRVFDIARKTSVNGNTESQYYASILPTQIETGEILFDKSFMEITEQGEFGGLEFLRSRGKKPVGLKFKYNWDGTPAKIEYKNTQGKTLNLTDEEARYLPFIPRRYVLVEQNGQELLASVDFTTEGAQKKIGLAQIIQEKLHDIEGILPRAKAVKLKDLHLVKVSGKTPEQIFADLGALPGGENLGNGQINIATDFGAQADGYELLRIMSHEMQHASDAIKMYRGGVEASNEALKRVGLTLEEWNKANEAEFADLNASEYIKRVINKKGLVAKGTPEYDEAVKLYEMNYRTVSLKDQTSVAQHDALPLEQRAIEREKQQIEFWMQVGQKLSKFLLQFYQ